MCKVHRAREYDEDNKCQATSSTEEVKRRGHPLDKVSRQIPAAKLQGGRGTDGNSKGHARAEYAHVDIRIAVIGKKPLNKDQKKAEIWLSCKR